jgi:hypothetical protein
MARLRFYPHRTADASSVFWHSWWIERYGDRSVLPPLLKGWDYASCETVGISVDLYHESLLESTGLESLHDLEIILLADCPTVQQRFIARASLQGHERGTTIDVALQLPPGQVASAVRLSAHLVLSHDTRERGFRVASLRGARVHSSETFILRLEGDASRFPTEPVPFSELGFGNAPWTVLTIYEELSDSFMGGVRLLINTEHPVWQVLSDPESAPRVRGLLRAEIVRLLIAKLAPEVDDFDESAFNEGSVGQVIDTMCQVFLGMGLKTAAHLYSDDPATFDLLLHDRLNPLAGLTS